MGTVAAAPLLLGMVSAAQAQQAPVPSFPGAMPIPGTDTQLKIGGYAKADIWYDHGTHEDIGGGGGATGTSYAGIPLDNNVPGSTPGTGHNIHGAVRESAAESRFNIETRTPTAYGLLSTVLEGDFEGVSGVNPTNTLQVNSNRTAFALRLAYGTLGPFLAGQTAPLFRDPASEPEVLDFGGALAAIGPLRAPEFRYTYAAGGGLSFAAALANPQTQFFGTAAGVPSANGTAVAVGGATGTTTFITGEADKAPDLEAAATYAGPWGHASLRGVARYLNVDNAGTGGTSVKAKKIGVGGAFTGDFNTGIGKDRLMWEVDGGPGIGRYSTNTGSAPGDLVITPTGSAKTISILGGLLAYQHYWSTQLRSTVEFSYMRFFYPKELFPAAAVVPAGALGSLDAQLESGHANLIYSPVPAVDFGYEFIYAQRKTEAGQRGNIYRSQVSAKFKF